MSFFTDSDLGSIFMRVLALVLAVGFLIGFGSGWWFFG